MSSVAFTDAHTSTPRSRPSEPIAAGVTSATSGTTPSTWSAILMHHDFWGTVRGRLRPGSVVFVNTSVFEAGEPFDASWRVTEVRATDIAVDAGTIIGASLVMVGAYAAATGIVGIDSLLAGLEASLPPYRRQHIPLSAAALRAGHECVAPGTDPAWSTTGAAVRT